MGRIQTFLILAVILSCATKKQHIEIAKPIAPKHFQEFATRTAKKDLKYQLSHHPFSLKGYSGYYLELADEKKAPVVLYFCDLDEADYTKCPRKEVHIPLEGYPLFNLEAGEKKIYHQACDGGICTDPVVLYVSQPSVVEKKLQNLMGLELEAGANLRKFLVKLQEQAQAQLEKMENAVGLSLEDQNQRQLVENWATLDVNGMSQLLRTNFYEVHKKEVLRRLEEEKSQLNLENEEAELGVSISGIVLASLGVVGVLTATVYLWSVRHGASSQTIWTKMRMKWIDIRAKTKNDYFRSKYSKEFLAEGIKRKFAQIGLDEKNVNVFLRRAAIATSVGLLAIVLAYNLLLTEEEGDFSLKGYFKEKELQLEELLAIHGKAKQDVESYLKSLEKS